MNCRYYLADEPGGNKVDPKLLEKAYNFVKVWTANQLEECQLHAYLISLQNLDAYQPITMVFCCVDPAQYINAFDIGNVLAVATYTVWFSSSSCPLCRHG